jgi:hypothetical protein
MADIRVDPDYEVLPGLLGSFREFVLFMNDRNPFTGSSLQCAEMKELISFTCAHGFSRTNPTG